MRKIDNVQSLSNQNTFILSVRTIMQFEADMSCWKILDMFNLQNVFSNNNSLCPTTSL